jgi:hypothetical protein
VQTPRRVLDIRTVLSTEMCLLERDNGALGVEEKVHSEYRAEAIVVANWPHKDCGTNALNIYDAEDGNFPVIHIEMFVNQTDAKFVCETVSSDDVEQALLHRAEIFRAGVSFTDRREVVICVGWNHSE